MALRVIKKPVYRSKLNWLGLIMTFLGLLLDPQFAGYLAEWIPAALLPKILSTAGMVTMAIRTFYTDSPIESPGR